jgi:hypothetical protein
MTSYKTPAAPISPYLRPTEEDTQPLVDITCEFTARETDQGGLEVKLAKALHGVRIPGGARPAVKVDLNDHATENCEVGYARYPFTVTVTESYEAYCREMLKVHGIELAESPKQDVGIDMGR